tara:strand:- start:766 stop:1383 length:618 start_codon:yes stop_codon:yes gene_type:complete
MLNFDEKYIEFKSNGGVLDIEISPYSNAYSLKHAQNVLVEEFLRKWDNGQYDWDKLRRSRVALSPDQFFGCFFDFELRKPLIRGVSSSHLNHYFLYDTLESVSNIMNYRIEELSRKFGPNAGGYSYAFLEPPSTLSLGNSILDKGEFFLTFSEYLFSDFEQIQVFDWDTSHSYFDAGHEWWGSFLWTIYNPIKRWNILIAASATD